MKRKRSLKMAKADLTRRDPADPKVRAKELRANIRDQWSVVRLAKQLERVTKKADQALNGLKISIPPRDGGFYVGTGGH